MPDYVAAAVDAEGLRAAYDRRSMYQRNDYLGWIIRAKRKETKMEKPKQMLEELPLGAVYMKMDWQTK